MTPLGFNLCKGTGLVPLKTFWSGPPPLDCKDYADSLMNHHYALWLLGIDLRMNDKGAARKMIERGQVSTEDLRTIIFDMAMFGFISKPKIKDWSALADAIDAGR